MKQRLNWQGLPYFPISQFYRQNFGEKVYKIPVSLADTCPNREGLKGMKTCVFCDVWGSAAYPQFREMDLRQQIEVTRERIRKRFNANQFLVYFQAYTTTFSRVERTRRAFGLADDYSDVKGYVIGTRPDCLSDSLFDLLNEYLGKKFIAVELGVQSFFEDQLLWMRRGHTAKKAIWAIEKIKEKCPSVDLGIHLIFGNKGETREQILATAKLVSSLPVDNVKLHNLHVLKNTPLEQMYLTGQFEPLTREEYSDRVILFLQHLDPRISVHRLSAVASRHEELVAPKWAGFKMGNYQFILDRFRDQDAFQGQFYNS